MTNTRIQFHPLLLIFLIVSYFLGLFLELICFFIIITIHELGHFIAARYYNWNISRVMVWPFGGVMETEDYYNRPSKEELIVTLSGPAQHIWIFAILFLLQTFSFQSTFLDQLLFANTIIFLFNLLPILPLDGGRILFVGITKLTPFHHSIAWMTMASIFIITLINVILYVKGWYGIHFTFLSIFLVLDNWLTWRNKHVFLLKHLLARYIVSDVDRTSINVLKATAQTPLSELVKQFKKECYHYIYFDNEKKPLSEDDCLRALFTRNEPHLTVAKVEGM